MSTIRTETLAETRMSEMSPELAEAVMDAMYADGYLVTNFFNPFSEMDPSYSWLRTEYAEMALQSLTA